MSTWDSLWTNARIATMVLAGEDPYGAVADGATYEEIARAGGGIVSTVRATRQASVDALVESALPRVRSLLREGVTTIEIKSGYGLDMATERRMLQAARRLPDHLPVDVATTFLGAHALPPEYAGNADGYIDLVCGEMIPVVAEAGEADAVDAFCESIGFTRAQTERVFQRRTIIACRSSCMPNN